MIESSDLICALNALLRDKFPGIRLYGSDVTDGMVRPYFFINVFREVSLMRPLILQNSPASLKLRTVKRHPTRRTDLRK